jgi:hypothetical protein
MKLAVLFYGRIKGYRNTYSSFKKTFDGHDVDIFYSCDAEDDSLIRDFTSLYSPIAICNEKITYTVDFGAFPNVETNVHNMTCHFINKMRVFQLLERHIQTSGTVYDSIISTRLDIIYTSPIPFCIEEKETIGIPEGNDYGGVNDQIAFGTLETMRVYMNIFTSAEAILKDKKCRAHPETLNMVLLRNNRIYIDRFPLEYYRI